MRCVVVLKSGVMIDMDNMSKEEINNIRFMSNTGTIGLGPDGAFIQRSEIAAITRKNGLESVNALKCRKCNGTGYQKSLSPSGIEFQCEICTNCRGLGILKVG